METNKITIQQKDYQAAIDELFNKYGVTAADVLDFNEVEGGFEFELSRLPDAEIALRATADKIIRTNNFMAEDLAFICSDGKVHTPEGSTLFARVCNLLQADITPMVGYANMIDASNDLAALETELGSGPVLFENLVLSKEGDMIKGTNVSRVASSRTQNARNMSDPVITLEMDLATPDKLAQFLNSAAEKLNFVGDLVCNTGRSSIAINLTGKCPMEVLNLIFKLAPHMMGMKEIVIKGADGDYKHKIKL
jgi:hypothetical protein